MLMTPKYLFAAAAIALAFSAQAKDKLVVSEKGGTKTQIEISQISEITFDGNTMVVKTPDRPLEFPTDNIEEVTFDLTVTGVEDITADLDGLIVAATGGTVRVDAAPDAPLTLDVFDMTGRRVISLNGVGSLSADMTPLPAGIYIIKANDKTIKYIR